jgi:guanylate kinase
MVAGEGMTGPREMLDPSALVILLIGSSAVGKSSLAVKLYEAGVVEPQPTWATRQPRPGEIDTCYDHHFVNDEAFDTQSRKGGFLAEEPLYEARYAVPFLYKPPDGQEALMVLKPVFIPKFKAYYPNTRVYQIEASPEVLPGRMRTRGQSEAEIATRMKEYDKEVADARRFADAIFHNDGPLQETYRQVKAQIYLDRQTHLAEQAA